jgi:hypothetical protein
VIHEIVRALMSLNGGQARVRSDGQPQESNDIISGFRRIYAFPLLCQIVPVGEMRGRGLRPRSSNVARKNASSGECFAARVDSADSSASVINNHRPS